MKIENLLKFALISMLPLIYSTSCGDKKKIPESLLWKLEYKNHVSWIFGTIHMPDTVFKNIPDQVRNAITSSDLFFTEMEPDEKNQVEISKGMMLPENQSLQELIGKERFAKVEKIIQSFESRISSSFLNKSKIWAVSLLIAYPKTNNDMPLDVLLYQEAKTSGKATRGIETPEEQIECLDNFTLDEQTQILDDAIKEAESGFLTVKAIKEDYLSQNLPAIMEIFISRETEFSPEFKEKYLKKLLVERNNFFFERLLPEFKNHNVFAAVGAGHIIGEKCLIKLFENEGFKVTPVQFQFEKLQVISGAEPL